MLYTELSAGEVSRGKTNYSSSACWVSHKPGLHLQHKAEKAIKENFSFENDVLNYSVINDTGILGKKEI